MSKPWMGEAGTLIAGIYEGLTYQEYDLIPALRSTYLCNLAEVPIKARAIERSTDSYDFGRALHIHVLEGQVAFESSYMIAGYCQTEITSKKSKNFGQPCGNQGIIFDGEDWYCGVHSKDVIAADNQKQIVTQEDMILIPAMARGIHTHPTASQLMQSGRPEVTVIWQDETTGLWCKARIDWLPDAAGGVVIDLKSSTSANLFAFNRKVKEYHYYIQAAMYLEGLRTVTGVNYDTLGFVVSEKSLIKVPGMEPITRCEVYQLDPETWEAIGRNEFHKLLAKEAACQENNNWPHYRYAGAEVLIAPGYLEVE